MPENIYSKTPILEYQQMYSKIGVYSKTGVIYEVLKNFGPLQKNLFINRIFAANIFQNRGFTMKSY